MWNLDGYLIIQTDTGYAWKKALTEELVMSGVCTLSDNLLILHSYESIEAETLTEAAESWDRTEYYMTVSETGVTEIIHRDGTPATDTEKKEIGTKVGCTLRFRQG